MCIRPASRRAMAMEYGLGITDLLICVQSLQQRVLPSSDVM